MEAEDSLTHSQRPPIVPILNHTNPVKSTELISWRSILILSSYPSLCLPSSLFPSAFPTTTLHVPLLFPYFMEFICIFLVYLTVLSVKVKVIHDLPEQTQRGDGSTVPNHSQPDTWWRWVFGKMLRPLYLPRRNRYPLNRKLGNVLSSSGNTISCGWFISE